ncbi:regulator of G-protein signaling 22 isoform X2 [Hemicordylus capensis]|uniref:regulator of G-protein signaling 22 isoform X2 n=1 Tax=Hemicordylus capensis TaxID=884348 RepID=UPI0023029D41|nr:regulator of G-protein signaling 22 isoform X2 [Hemicordylus capensis]
MREKRLTTVPPCIRDNEFEDYLATDDILVDFFNEFLSLPTFAEPIKFNPDFGIFEVVNDTPQRMENQLKKMLHQQKPRNPIYDVMRPSKPKVPVSKELDSKDSSPLPQVLSFDPNYTTVSLDREQAIRWIKRERFPSFLESDCYFEYRLAKLISQVEWSKTGINFVVDKAYYPWFTKSPPPPEKPEENEDDLIMKRFYVSLGQATVTQTQDWFTLAKISQNMITTDSMTRPVASSHVHFSIGSSPSSSYIDFMSPYVVHRLSTTLLNEAFFSNQFARDPKGKRQSKTNILQGTTARRSIDEGNCVLLPDTPSHTQLRAYLGQNWDAAPQEGENADLDRYEELASFQTVDEFSLAYTQYILRNAVTVLTGQPPEASPKDVNFGRVTRVFIYEIANSQPYMEPPLQKSPPLEDNITDKISEVSISLKSEKESSESRAAWCMNHKTYDIGSRNEFERFKRFIKGTLGERYWWLWMDIERLKVLKDPKRQKRQLDRMKKIYLVSNGDYFLTSEVLLKLDLTDGGQWNIDNLKRIQPEVVKPLLLYWGPRFCVTHTAATQAASTKLKMWHSRQQKPRMDVDPFPQMVSLLPLRAKSCMPKITSSYHQRGDIRSPSPLTKAAMLDTYSLRSPRLLSAVMPRSQSAVKEDPDALVTLADINRQRPATVCSSVTRITMFTDKMEYLKPQLDRRYTYAELIQGKTSPDICELGSSKMERMLQSLDKENRAGYIFTAFCEKSRNKLWKNSTYFWFDLQDYHQLFYQETLHPFKLCKQAQFLYATYIAPSASMDIGLQQITKSEIYQKTEPPFEDLFDPAEEYILTLLLDPWMKMVEQDRETYGQVGLMEETRQLDSVYFRKLQALREESISKKGEDLAVDGEVSRRRDSTKAAEHPSQVLEELTSYNLNDLIRNKLNLEEFRLFLEQNSASMDLLCWIDIEQFRRMLHKDKEQREEKLKEIKNKYLNKKYFFGPDSPATKEEQDQIMKLAGGWGQILHERVPPLILLEIQKSIQMRLEKKWLPQFMTSEEPSLRKKSKPYLQDAAEDILIQKQDKKKELWKHVDNKWVSSSREIITFRKALSNPITAFQFQRYVALKGDLLENGVLFWQEVQKYKDMCHSHCDDAIIQNKITTIINCFINSSIPPALQIDIPEEQAQKIIENRRELGPYVFREAQMTIFALLFKFWPTFCEFRANLADESRILPALEKRKEKKPEIQKREEDKLQRKKATTSPKRTGSPDSESKVSKGELSSTPSFSGFGRQISWTYNKYLEAIQQERVLLKIQEDLEKKSLASSVYTGTTNIFSLRSDRPGGSGRSGTPTPFRTAFLRQQRTFLPKDNENPN